jgi:hypothetical protein
MFHRKSKNGFAKLRPEDEEAEKVLREFEAGKYGPKVEEKEPLPPAKKAPEPDLTEDLDPVIREEARRKKGYKKLVP